MLIDNSGASKCRYGSDAVKAFGGADVIWEHAEDDYQGAVAIVFKMPDGRHGFYEWWYGSCSGCDDWEARDLTTEEIQTEMLSKAAMFPDAGGLLAWLDMTDATGASYRPKRAEIAPLLAT